jgi:MFS transporter, NNP family, nitrate/nitrite transporter
MRRNHRITDWNAEDAAAWEAGNKDIARRNLLCTVAGDHVAFSIWSLWSVMALFMPASVYGFSAGDKLLLGAVATLVGGCARIPYTLGIARFGGRNWTTFSAFVLLIPTAGTIALLANPGLPLWPYVVCAALTGLGGANYAASLANVNAFYPQRLKGAALAINAGVGNLGVAAIQLVGLLVLAASPLGGHHAAYWVCAVYLVLLAVVRIAAALLMDNLDHGIEVNTMRSVLRERDTYVISLLYICTFGSWIGFAFAFGQLLQVHFAAGGETARHASLHAAQIAFLGPLLGSLARIYGGRLADRIGGSRVTLGVLGGMVLGAGLLVTVSTLDDRNGSAGLIGYVAGFVALFVLAGMGNGSVFKMIPSIFEARSRRLDADEAQRRHWSRAMSGSLIGFCSAVGAFGGVGIDLALRESYLRSGTETSAYWIFLACYVGAAAMTWRLYVRPRTPAPNAPESVLDAEPARV